MQEQFPHSQLSTTRKRMQTYAQEKRKHMKTAEIYTVFENVEVLT